MIFAWKVTVNNILNQNLWKKLSVAGSRDPTSVRTAQQPSFSQEIVLMHMYSASISHVTAAGVNPVGSSPSSI